MIDITTAECAARLGISVRRVRDMLAAGQIVGAVRIGEGNRATWQIPVGCDGLPRTRDWTRGVPGRRPRSGSDTDDR